MRIDLLVVTLLVLGRVHGGTTEAESSVFSFDTRDSSGTTASVSNVFGVDARDLGNGDSQASGTFALNTVSGAPVELEIVGPSQVASGSVTSYAVKWHTATSVLDVTDNVRWKFLTGAPGNTGMVPPNFYAGETPIGAATTIVASYIGPNGKGMQSAPFTITILPRMQVALGTSNPGGQQGVRLLDAGVEGASGATTINWDLDGDGQFDDATGATVTRDYGTWTGTTTVKVEVVDAQGNRRIEERQVVLNKAPVANQPVVKPAYDPTGFDLYLPDIAKSNFVFNAGGITRRDSGLVVIAHGLYSGADKAWLGEMGRAIENRCGYEGIDPPDIALMDWSSLAGNPSELPFWLRFSIQTLVEESIKSGDGLTAAVGVGTGAASTIINFGFDLYWVREFGLITGQQLANWIYMNSSIGGAPQINKTKPIHLIGHSAGGFVVGEAAKFLKHPASGHAQVLVDRVTMLDTPFVERSHIASGAKNYPNPGVAERYISSKWGGLSLGGLLTFPNSYYRRVNVWSAGVPLFNLASHGYAHDWYTKHTIWGDTILDRLETDGFYHSPIINENTRIQNKGSASASSLTVQSSMKQQAAAVALPDVLPAAWQTFGNAVESAGTWTATEADDAGMWSDISITATSKTLAFDFHFSGSGDGDFLAVHLGDLPVLFRGLDLSLSRDSWLPVEIPLDLIPVMDGKLVFTLVSRGEVNAQVQVRNIRIIQSDDADEDGLTVDEETLAGTDPRSYDSDGDGLSDGEEVNTHLTDANRKDSDGDNHWDGDELRAGTDPLQNGSYFRIHALTREPTGTITIRWPGKVGNRYTVYRSQELGTGNLDVMETGIEGEEPEMTWSDDNPPAGHAFYWVKYE
ncbi:MAG: hypothetical protein H7A51_10495 [Akkermansiaceae bacterium]|nr:hypothetical protein [Akkermansiaceae bacterium]